VGSPPVPPHPVSLFLLKYLEAVRTRRESRLISGFVLSLRGSRAAD
jgi:hypothetical protein